IRALVILADDDRQVLDSAVLSGESLEVVDYSEGLNEDWQTFLKQPSDIVLVACSQYSERVLHLIDRAAKQRPDRPVVVVTETSPNGALRQAFEAGADDVVTLPQSPDAVRFALEKVIARRKGSASVAGRPPAPLA